MKEGATAFSFLLCCPPLFSINLPTLIFLVLHYLLLSKKCTTLSPLVLVPQKRRDKCRRRGERERGEGLEMRTKTAGEEVNAKKEERIRRGATERREGAVEAISAAARHISAMRCED